MPSSTRASRSSPYARGRPSPARTMPSTSATIVSTGSVQPSSASSAVPSGQVQVGWKVRASTAAMPIAAVSTRGANLSIQSAYAGSSGPCTSSPRSLAVTLASALPSPASSRLSRLSRLSGSWSRVARREASRTSATRARQWGTVTSVGCSAKVIGCRRSERPSVSSAATCYLVPRDQLRERTGHRPPRSGLGQPAGRVRALQEVAQPGERVDVEASPLQRRLEPLGSQHVPGGDHLVARRQCQRGVRGGEPGLALAGAGPVLQLHLEGPRPGPQQPGQPGARPGQQGAPARRGYGRCRRGPPVAPSGPRARPRRRRPGWRPGPAHAAHPGPGTRGAAGPRPAHRRPARAPASRSAVRRRATSLGPRDRSPGAVARPRPCPARHRCARDGGASTGWRCSQSPPAAPTRSRRTSGGPSWPPAAPST